MAPSTVLFNVELFPTGCGAKFTQTPSWLLLLTLRGTQSDTHVTQPPGAPPPAPAPAPAPSLCLREAVSLKLLVWKYDLGNWSR